MKIYPSFTLESNKGLFKAIQTNVKIDVSETIRFTFRKRSQLIDTTAIWDTGATDSVISEKIAKNLGLDIIDQTQVNVVGTSYDANVYLVDFILPNNVKCPNIRVTGASQIGGCECLIGMDIIAHGDFCITCIENKRSCFTFRLPSLGKKIDFVEQSKKTMQRQYIKKNYTKNLNLKKK